MRCIEVDPFKLSVEELTARINELYLWPKTYRDALSDPRCGCDESGLCEWNDINMLFTLRDILRETDQLFPREEHYTSFVSASPNIDTPKEH